MRYMQKFAGVPRGWSVNRQWSTRRQFSAFSVAIRRKLQR